MQKPRRVTGDSSSPEAIVRSALEQGQSILEYQETFHLLKTAGIPFVECVAATSSDEAVEVARRIGLPVAVKASSSQLVHKSDVGGVVLNLKSEDEVRTGYRQVVENVRRATGVQLRSIVVQKMAPPGLELIIGMNRDPQFGPVLMFGLGGTFTEVLKDVSFRISPLEKGDVEEMIFETRGSALLKGFRGSRPADTRALVDCMLRLSQLAVQINTVKEVDFNPVFVYEDKKGLTVVDARVILAQPRSVDS